MTAWVEKARETSARPVAAWTGATKGLKTANKRPQSVSKTADKALIHVRKLLKKRDRVNETAGRFPSRAFRFRIFIPRQPRFKPLDKITANPVSTSTARTN
jgi:hypothetical protein